MSPWISKHNAELKIKKGRLQPPNSNNDGKLWRQEVQPSTKDTQAKEADNNPQRVDFTTQQPHAGEG